jgi:DNA-binding response OmpR family regulator
MIFGILLSNKYPRNEALLSALADDDCETDTGQRLRVLMSTMRKKLAAYGIEIKTHAGVGYEMAEESKARVRELMPA